MYGIASQYRIWPNDDFYLERGIEFLIFNSQVKIGMECFIFVDFSKFNIRYFTNSVWINHLKTTGSRIILISDKTMCPIAYYWKKKHDQIITVISTEDNLDEIEKKISCCFRGLRDKRQERNKLKDIEITVLDLTLSGKTVREINKVLSLSDKKIYAIKNCLQKKMGGKGRLNAAISG